MTPTKITELIDRFAMHLESYAQADYKEARVRAEFIDPMFQELGWDVTNQHGYAEAYKEVVHEDALKVGRATKAPDYSFRIGGQRKFFVEAKKPSVNIKQDGDAAYQLRRYAWSAKLSLSILTNFQEFAVYDCRIKPNKNDSAATARVMYLTYEEYAHRWPEIAAIFAKEAILKGAFDKFSDSHKGKRGTAEVDAAFLEEISRWREGLARHIALRNPELSQRQLNFAVQRTIDRIIFLRICEDRGIEPYGRLLALTNGTQCYERLGQLCRLADDRYNSGLFHFKTESGRSDDELDLLTLGLQIDDVILQDILKHLYYPDSPYEFSVLPADILGQVYEQFLGQVIRLTAGHQAKVEEKPEVKKAGGVFYTPTYIVNYIVQQTVGQLLADRKVESTSPLRIVDPACGSGSFLLGAYQFLLDWYLAQYSAESGRWAKGRVPRLYQTDTGGWKLTLEERKRILLAHLFGVDIDSQAVEVTKLSLLLKVLEGETEQSLGRQLSFLQARVLPDLGRNIKCGNSLIGGDFYDGQQAMLLFDEAELYRVNAFDWGTEFALVMQEGGFEVVLGNPPYVRQESLKESKHYFESHYEVYQGTADLYSYFMEKGLKLLKEGGIFSYIVANKWLRANYGKPLRQWLRQYRLLEITDFGDLPVFQSATTYPCIVRLERAAPTDTFSSTQVKTLDFVDLGDYVQTHGHLVKHSTLTNGWTLVAEPQQALLDKLKQRGMSLTDYVQGKIYRGLITGLNEAFVIDEATRERLIAQDPKSAEVIKPFLAGREVKRYEQPQGQNYLIFMPKGWTPLHDTEMKAWNWLVKNYPAIAKQLKPFSDAAKKRQDKGNYWWELRACDYYAEFDKPKIIYPNICKQPEFAFDNSAWYTNQKCFIIPIDDKYLLGILNSKVTFFLFKALLPKLRGDFYEPSYVYFKKFPIRPINFADPTDAARHARMVSLVQQMLTLQQQFATELLPQTKTMLKRQIGTVDRQIDALVYELYGLSEDELGIIN